ncbi:uncharacterized protein LOC107042558 [Diachasma alloeum]|uniref:uncharacterized protein LOC107042558 n=1 Tax=Diachasma alloeum TaxID=454923 RepID=UPI0007381A98|nr:uncharacterized protein LOC107042558 [Diachasma alloeum]XP_015119118.1 uncharacterized protein LOC107042558 [Diachasma alloeum]
MCKKTGIFFSLLIITLLPIVHLSQVSSQCGGDSASHKPQDNLALYKITLDTYWTRIRFPKNYPDQRAQFGKLIGQTHDRTYSLYRLGTRLNSGIAHYIETGETNGIASEGNNPNVFDSFSGLSILRGDGTSSTRAFVDSNHTLVSIVSRITPSPDWFIGVDSFQLCIDGDWIDTVTVELDPLDAGTHEGITFTAMHQHQRSWPQNLAYRITSRYPAHPAASFNYPNLPRLPPIATLTFTKLKEYSLTGVYHQDQVEMEFVSIEGASSRYSPVNEAISKTVVAVADHQKYGYWMNNSTQYTIGNNKEENAKAAIIDGIVSSYNKFPVGKYTHDERLKGNFDLDKEPKRAPIRQNKRPIIKGRIVNSTSRPTNSLFLSNRPRVNHRLHIKNRGIQWRGKLHQRRAPRDCKSSDWTAWSACSRSCGVGETQRVRKIIVKARRGGKPCHSLKETKWCGSATPCPDSNKQIDHFHIN